MRRLWLWPLLAACPAAVLAQQGSLLDQRPFKNDAFTPPPPPITRPLAPGEARRNLLNEPPANQPITAEPPPWPSSANPNAAPPDDITAAPLPPPDRAEQLPEPDTVPNPLGTPIPKTATDSGLETPPLGQPRKGGWVQMASATLQALDKVNARSETLVVKVGDVTRFGSLDIGVRGCFVRPPDWPADATAFLFIRDQRADTPAFNGWMVRSAPYMSMMANPIYDVRVVGCSP